MAQTVVTCEDGRIWRISAVSEQGDSLSTDSGRIAKRDVLFVTMDKKDYVYNSLTGEKTRVKLKESCRACRAGRAYAAKYAGSGLELEGFRPPVPARLLGDTLFIKFFRREMYDRDVPVDADGHLRKAQAEPKDTARAQKEVLGTARKALLDRHVVYLRNGDSLEVNADFFPKKDTLCWFGGGRLPKDDVLAFQTGNDQWVLTDKSSSLAKVRPAKNVHEPCAKGELLTLIYDGSKTTDARINQVNSGLLQDPNVRACFLMPERAGDPDKRRSFVSLGIGAGPGHGMLGVRTVVGPDGSGLALGLGTLDGQLCYSAGLQVLLGHVLYLNGSYGTYQVGAISNGPGQAERKYSTEGYNIFMGVAPRIGKEKKFFLEVGVGYSGGGSAPGPFGTQPTSGVGFDVGLGFQL